MKLNKALTRTTLLRLLVVLILSIGISGCARVVLHPIDKADIVQMAKGTAYTPEKDGWFLSNYYLEKVVQAKVEK